MSDMFYGAIAFDQDISDWKIGNVYEMNYMFGQAGLSATHYDSLLVKWAASYVKFHVVFDAGSSKYSSGLPADSKALLKNTKGWVIRDGGMVQKPTVITTPASQITPSGAVCGGTVTSDGGQEVTSRGMVWHTEPDPTTDIHTGISTNGVGIGSFENLIENLEWGTLYYVRAYATNSTGTEYGNTIEVRAAQELHLSGNFATESKIYDRTTRALLVENNLVLEGILGEYPEVALDEVELHFETPFTGEGKTVFVTAASLKGSHAPYYLVSARDAPTTTAAINPCELRMGGSFTVASKLHDGTALAAITQNNLTLLTPIEGDDVALGDVVAQFDDASGGKNKRVWISEAELAGNDSNNYYLSLDNAPETSSDIIIADDGTHMQLVFDTRLSEGTTITLPFDYSTLNILVFWGDGKSDAYTTAGLHSHTYESEGVYTVTITGTCNSFGYMFNTPDIEKLVEAISFGDLGLISLASAFRGAVNLTKVPDKLPPGILYTSDMFGLTSSFSQDLSNWDVGNVKNFRFMFASSAFNGDISNWDVSMAEDMRGMFQGASAFNQDISAWDMSNVTQMEWMFWGASSFNQDIGNWNISKVENLEYMFYLASSFSQNLDKWDVSSVITMENMFKGASSFNGEIGLWDVSKVTNMKSMFEGASSFNGQIENWDVVNVTDMSSMFKNAPSFDQNIGKWKIENALLVDMLLGSKLSTSKYDGLLLEWAARDISGKQFHGGSSQYSSGAAAEAREKLINEDYWWITDGGMDINTGVSEISQTQLRVFPNPFLHTLEVEGTKEITQLVLLNTSGQVVGVAAGKKLVVNGQLPEGVYWLRIESENHAAEVVKVVKK